MTRLSSYDLEPNSVDERGRDGARQFCWERQQKEIHKVHAASGAKVVRYEDWMGLVDSLSYLSDEFANSSQNVETRPTEAGAQREAQYRLNEQCSAPELTASPLLPQKATAATAESIRRRRSRPPASPCSSCSCRHSAAAKWPSTARVDEAETSETERGNANPIIPSMLYQQRARSKSAKNVTMRMSPQGHICV